MNQTTFNKNNNYTIIHNLQDTDQISIRAAMKYNHETIVQTVLQNRPYNSITNRPTPKIDESEQDLDRHTRRKLSQLRTNKSPLLLTYLHKIDATNHPTDIFPLYNIQPHDTSHLFNCLGVPTSLTVLDLWRNPTAAVALLAVWGEKMDRPWMNGV